MQATLVITVAMVVSAPGLKDPPKKPNGIIGEWVVQSIVSLGTVQPQRGEPQRFVFKPDNKWIAYRGERKLTDDRRGFVAADKKDPPTIDLLDDVSDPKNQKTLGIYKVDGDTLTLCIGRFNGDRPKNFEPAADAPASLYTLIRVK
jgi:uncharacterized protein (TIGR03067 family)